MDKGGILVSCIGQAHSYIDLGQYPALSYIVHPSVVSLNTNNKVLLLTPGLPKAWSGSKLH